MPARPGTPLGEPGDEDASAATHQLTLGAFARRLLDVTHLDDFGLPFS